MRALGLDAPRGAANDPMAYMVTIDGSSYYTDPMDGSRALFLLNDSNWAALGREVYEDFVCDMPSAFYSAIVVKKSIFHHAYAWSPFFSKKA